MKNLNHTTSEINRDFRIKVYGMVEGTKVNTLVGVSGAVALIGTELFNTLLNRAYACTADVCVCKLRRGLKFSFYNK